MFLCNDHRVALLWWSWSSLEGVGPVDEVEIQVLQLQVFQGLQEGWLHILWVMFSVPQLGCDEHVLSSQRLTNTHHMHRVKVHAENRQDCSCHAPVALLHLACAERFLQCFSDLHLVGVDGGAVNVAISGFQRPNDCLFHLWTETQQDSCMKKK